MAQFTDIGVDLYNLLNSNYPTAYQATYSYTQPNGGTWSGISGPAAYESPSPT